MYVRSILYHESTVKKGEGQLSSPLRELRLAEEVRPGHMRKTQKWLTETLKYKPIYTKLHA